MRDGEVRKHTVDFALLKVAVSNKKNIERHLLQLEVMD